MSGTRPELGVKMSADEAKSFVEELNQKVVRRWEERITRGPFMRPFTEGRLPLAAVKLFYKNWGAFTVEINTPIAASYHKHIGFFKCHPDLLAPRSRMSSYIPNRRATFWLCSRPQRLSGSLRTMVISLLTINRQVESYRRGSFS